MMLESVVVLLDFTEAQDTSTDHRFHFLLNRRKMQQPQHMIRPIHSSLFVSLIVCPVCPASHDSA